MPRRLRAAAAGGADDAEEDDYDADDADLDDLLKAAAPAVASTAAAASGLAGAAAAAPGPAATGPVVLPPPHAQAVVLPPGVAAPAVAPAAAVSAPGRPPAAVQMGAALQPGVPQPQQQAQQQPQAQQQQQPQQPPRASAEELERSQRVAAAAGLLLRHSLSDVTQHTASCQHASCLILRQPLAAPPAHWTEVPLHLGIVPHFSSKLSMLSAPCSERQIATASCGPGLRLCRTVLDLPQVSDGASRPR